MKLCFKILLLVVLIMLPQKAFAAGWQWITPERVYGMITEGSGLWLIDVRGEMTFNQGHIEGSVNIPTTTLSVKRFPRQKILVLTGDSLGLRHAKTAANTLVKNGQERVYVLEGGITAWQGEGLPYVAGGEITSKKVMAHELKWAIENNVRLKIIDLRDKKIIEQGKIPSSVQVAGKNFVERVKKLGVDLKKTNTKDLAAKLKKPVTTVLVFPAGVNAKELMDMSLSGVAGDAKDIRYLEGGYAAWSAKPGEKVTGYCPVCPGARKSQDKGEAK